MAERRDQVVKRLWTGLKSLVDKNKVTWIQGQGRLDGPTHVRVEDGSRTPTTRAASGSSRAPT